MNLDKLNPLKLNEKIQELTADNAKLTEAVEVKEKALNEFKEQAKADAESFATTKADLLNQIETLKGEHAKAVESIKSEHASAIENLSKQVTEANESTNKKAANLVTSMGVEVGTVKETISSDLSPAQIRQKFESMPAGEQRTAYYNKHKAVINSPAAK